MKVSILPSHDTGERKGGSVGADGNSSDPRDLEVKLTNSTPFLLSLLQIAGTSAEGENKVRDRFG
jgi:hypothetical protein